MTSNPAKLYFGAAFYPEHWPEERWADEIRWMREANMNVARLGEFAWSSLEPSEGEFDLDWLARAVEQLAAAGILSVLGTPTAAPPTWLVEKYPLSLAVDEYGRRAQVGNRCHYCVNAPEFHTATQRIVRAMAECFGPSPHVIGWQLDNEFHRVCYCDRCRQLFQKYLRGYYGDLRALNDHWATAYWSQSYSAWEQIPLPIGNHNPGLMLAFRRFVTESYRRFQMLQIEALRPYLPPQVWITHNFMRWFDGFDHYELSRDLDLASWDWYVATGHHRYPQTGAMHDLVRGFKRRNFWVMETQPGHVNWSPVNNALHPGEARAMAYHAVAHGADALLYWQWRSALGGQEQYHGTLIDPSGQPRPFYGEAQRIGAEFARLSPLIAATTVAASVAIVQDYESRWAIQWQRHHQDFDYVAHLEHYYTPLAQRNVPVDILGAPQLTDASQLSTYQLVIVPALTILSEELAAVFLDYVTHGGHLVLTLRTGMKDRHNALLPYRQPGYLAQAAGVEVEEYYALDVPVPVEGKVLKGFATRWAERLRLLEARATAVMATYGRANGWLDKHPAITVKGYRQGLIYYVGAYLDEAAQQTLVNRLLTMAKIPSIVTPPEVELSRRVSADGAELYFLINHANQPKRIQLPWPVYDHLTQGELRGEWELGAYGVAVFSRIADQDAPAEAR